MKMYVKEGIKQVANVTMYYKIQGKGETVVVLHGGPGMNLTYFFPHFERLPTYRLLFYDQRGCGKSSGSTELTVNTFVNDLEGIRKAFNLDTMNLLGHSWGGLLALHYGVLHPEKVNSLILVNTALVTAELLAKQHRKRVTRLTDKDKYALEKIVQSPGFAHKTPQAIKAFFTILEGTNFYDRRLIDKFFLEYTKKAARNALFINEIMQKDILQHDVRKYLSQIDCPTFIIHGDYDTVPVKAAYEICELIKGSRCVILKNCGHYPFIESPEEFFKIVKKFLDSILGQY